MFDFLRNITKPEEEKRRERLNAYLDGALSSQERRRFEKELGQDAELRAELEQLRWVKLSVQRLPRARAPRNFILDPAIYGQQARDRRRKSGVATPQFYPGLRVATALTAFFFVLALALDLATPYGALRQPLVGGAEPQIASEEPLRQADDVAMVPEGEVTSEPPAEEEAVQEEALPEEEEVPLAPFAVTEAPAAAEVAADAAEEAAEEVEEPVTGDALGEVTEDGAAEQPEPEQQPARQTGAAATVDERAVEATTTPEVAAMAPQETAPSDEESAALAVATETPPSSAEAAPADTDVEEPAREPFSYLLIVEIALGAALAALAVVLLVARRGV